MPSVSLMIHTASADSFLAEQGIPSYFGALVRCLQHQAFTNFELVYVDTYHEENRERFTDLANVTPFQIKHVAVHPEHRYWYDQGYCYISAAKNTGILYADGELLISCDDAEFFPAQFLEAYWRHYQAGRYMHALHKRYRSMSVQDGQVVMPLAGDCYINDHRWHRVAVQNPLIHRYGTLCFAGTSFSLGDALMLNGFNERMDGCKSLEDCDFGNRLKWLGRSFALDQAGWAAILDHPSYSEGALTSGPDGQLTPQTTVLRRKIESFIAVENHGMLRCAVELSDCVANKQPVTPQHLAIIQADTIKYRHFDPLTPEHADKLAIWLATPTFDLRQQREALRHSSDWIW